MSIAFSIAFSQVVVFVCCVLYCSFFEHLLHRRVLHARFPLLPYPYKLHQLQHHVLFKADESYHANDETSEHITFAPLDYLLLLSLHGLLFLGFEYLTGIQVMIGGIAAVLAYLVAFDVFHLAFHEPRWWVARMMSHFGFFSWLKEHHRIHHGTHYRNLNVVLPLADLCFGTLHTKPINPEKVLKV